jgi:Raf kinase inhibitor-like YbhB/YbcL family protein
MGKFFLGLALILLVIAGAAYYFYNKSGSTFGLDQNLVVKGTINISSQEFLNGAIIPIKYTCDWQNINPSFSIDRVPGDAKSLVLIVDDPDAKPTFTHWLVFNIDPMVTNIAEDSIPSGATVGTNDFGKSEYGGPCPPTGAHKYYFRIYALDTILTLDETARRADLDKAIGGHIIAKGEFYGEYEKNN